VFPEARLCREKHGVSAGGEQRCGNGAGRAAADDQYISLGCGSQVHVAGQLIVSPWIPINFSRIRDDRVVIAVPSWRETVPARSILADGCGSNTRISMTSISIS
jgi:hypothetical protein